MCSTWVKFNHQSTQRKVSYTGETVAIKRVLRDERFKNRELHIMRRLDHCNIVELLYYFYLPGQKKGENYLNLVLEFVPETLFKAMHTDQYIVFFD